MVQSLKFKKVKGFPQYTICNDGFIIGPTGIILKPILPNKFSKQYHIYIKHKSFNLAKLVMDHFVPSELGKDNVLHLDWITEHNQIDNLKRTTLGDLRRHYKTGKLRGVSRWKSGPYVKWRAYEGGMNDIKTIGYFKTKDEAYLVYQSYFLDKHGYAPF